MNHNNGRGLIIAAPASGSGKTVVTLGILRAFKNKGIDIGSLKIGPDFIDPAFHSLATGSPCRSIDFWSMRPATLNRQVFSTGTALIVAEGVMGLFDGASGLSSKENGSTYAVAEKLGLPIILVVDASSKGQSIAATVHGFSTFYEGINIAGLILNKVGSDRHQKILLNLLHLN